MAEIDRAYVFNIVKHRLGITGGVRDEYIKHLVNATIDELEKQKGIRLEGGDSSHVQTVVEYAAWKYMSTNVDATSGKYQSKSSTGAMPRYLNIDLHNLVISAGGRGGGDSV